MKTTIDTLTRLQTMLSQTSTQINAINRYNSKIIHLISQLVRTQSIASSASIQNSINLQVNNQIKSVELPINLSQLSSIPAMINQQSLDVYQKSIAQFTNNFESLRQHLLELSKVPAINSEIDLENIMENISIEGDQVSIQSSGIEHLSLTINITPAPQTKESKRKLSIYDFAKDILIPLLAILIGFLPYLPQELSESFVNHIEQTISSLEKTIDYHDKILEELLQSFESSPESQNSVPECDCTQHCNDTLSQQK